MGIVKLTQQELIWKECCSLCHLATSHPNLLAFHERLRRNHRTNARSSTMHRVGTYEILEQVFTCLDRISLRQARLVNIFWHSIIEQNAGLCATYRQRLRLRQLRVVLLGESNFGRHHLIKDWCYSGSAAARLAYDPKMRDAHVSLPQADGETWLAEMSDFGGEAGSEVLGEGLSDGKGRVGAYVLVYDVVFRHSFEVFEKIWRIESLSTHDDQSVEREEESTIPTREDSGSDGKVQSHFDLLNFFTRAEQRNECERHRGRYSTTGGRPVLLALIATNDELDVAFRQVQSFEGRDLAAEMDVPFFQISMHSQDPAMDVKAPLKCFWQMYRKGWMKERVRVQKRMVEGSGVLQKRGLTDGEGEQKSAWWSRCAWQ